MKVLVCGYHNPHFINTVVYREQALRRLGHEVITFEEQGYCIPGRIRQRFSWLHDWDTRRLNYELIRRVKSCRPDVCLIVGGNNILPTTVKAIARLKVPIALWTTDVPLDFDVIRQSAGFYTHLFCAGTEAVDIFKAQGLTNVTWLPFACDVQVHKKVSLSHEERVSLGRDIVFVGSYYDNRAKILESIADYNLGVWGPYWSRLDISSPLRAKAHSVKLNHDVWVKIFNACAINVVIHYQDGKTPCHQASPKLFEALACGCFVLSDRQKDAVVLFHDKEHLVFFDGENDLKDKIDYYLAHPEERARIAANGQRLVIEQHQFEHRMAFILDVLTKKH